ncbi:MAG: LemA family protein [Bacteroidaceae bacterium]|nr:LemA family protein [Bacteroidaceae bacterium]
MSYIVITIAVVVIIAVLVVVLFYNNLVSLRNFTNEAWSNVDVFLTKRHELIPQLVNTVKGYAEHERTVLERLTILRSEAIAADTPGKQLAVEDKISKLLADIRIQMENYPDLKANENFLALQRQITEMETEIERSRRYLNGCVRNYNTAVETFPNNLVAGVFGFKRTKFFEVESEGVRQSPTVSVR